MPGLRIAKAVKTGKAGSKKAAKPKRAVGVRASGPGTGSAYNGAGGFKPGNKYGGQGNGKQKNPQQYTSEQYAKVHGISHAQASQHLSHLYTKGHASGGTIGGTTHVKVDAPYPANSKLNAVIKKHEKSGDRHHDSASYAKQHGITATEASNHLRKLHQQGHITGGSIGGKYWVPKEAPGPPNSKALAPTDRVQRRADREVARTAHDVRKAQRKVDGAKAKLAAHDAGTTPAQKQRAAHLESLQKELDAKHAEVLHHKARLKESEAKIAKLKKKSESETARRKALASDLRAARKSIKDKDDRQTFARHAKLLREHRQGKKTITKEHAKVIRERLRAHGEGTVKPPTIRQQAEAHRSTKNPDDRLKAQTRHRRLQATKSAQAHEPGHVGMVATHAIHADPSRFQYKQGASETGSVGSLAGVQKFDHNLAGVVQVWKDPADGKVYVVNGHNRLDLAKKMGEEQITARYLTAKNHREARSIGALTNIAEGRGTAIDAAKYFKDTGLTREQIAEKGIPLREKVATDGIALSKLDAPLFKKVVDGDISVERGAIIGGSGLTHPEQSALVKLLDRKKSQKEITNSHLKELTDEVKSARSVRTTTNDLFGSHEDDHSLALHKTKLQSDIKTKLSKEKKLFGIVAKSKHAEDLAKAGNTINTHESGKISDAAAQTLGVFDRLKNLSGPVSRELNDAAERIHKGENARKVTDETYRKIVKHIPEMLAGGGEFAA